MASPFDLATMKLSGHPVALDERVLHDEGSSPSPTRAHSFTEPVWSRTGGDLFYRHGDRMMAVVAMGTTPVLTAGSTTDAL